MKPIVLLFLITTSLNLYSQNKRYDSPEFCGYRLGHKGVRGTCASKFQFADRTVLCHIAKIEDGLIYSISISSEIFKNTTPKEEIKYFKKFMEKKYNLKFKKGKKNFRKMRRKYKDDEYQLRLLNNDIKDGLLNYFYKCDNEYYKIYIGHAIAKKKSRLTGLFDYSVRQDISIHIIHKRLSEVNNYERYRKSPEYLKIINEKEHVNPNLMNRFVKE